METDEYGPLKSELQGAGVSGRIPKWGLIDSTVPPLSTLDIMTFRTTTETQYQLASNRNVFARKPRCL